MPIMTISESYIALKKEELITMKAYSKTWISLYICVSYNNCLFYMLQNRSNKILLCWFLSLSNIKQIKNLRKLNTVLVISSTEDKIQYFMKLRLHTLISQGLHCIHLWCAGSNHLLLATIKLALIYNVQSLKPVYLPFYALMNYMI